MRVLAGVMLASHRVDSLSWVSMRLSSSGDHHNDRGDQRANDDLIIVKGSGTLCVSCYPLVLCLS